jgi:hypothetical protein
MCVPYHTLSYNFKRRSPHPKKKEEEEKEEINRS